MIEFLRQIKKDFLKKYLFSYFLYIVVTVVYLCFLIKDFSVSSLLISILGFILISGLLLFVGRAILVKFLNERLGSQEVISRSIFKNTRIVINNLSHEIRTPLNAIMGFAANLYEEETDENKQKALLAIKGNSERLFSTAKKIIDFSSIETGHFEINKEFICNHALLGNLVTKYKGEIDRKNLRLSIINTIPEHGFVYTDQNALFEILEMLLENAIKFTEKGSITIESSYHNGELEYTLEDTGSGISDQQKDIVFQLYRQGNSNMDREYEGIGLGLTIADKLTQMLEGSITLSDSESGGVKFRIIIKTDFQEPEQRDNRASKTYFPVDLSSEEKREVHEALLILDECVKVFNPGLIRKTAMELREKNEKYKELSQKLIMSADTYNESEFSQIIRDLLKGKENEN